MEEIIWYKVRNTSPVTPINRVHETVAIFGLGKAKINNLRLPITEKRRYEPEKIVRCIKALSTAFNNPDTFEKIKNYFERGEIAMKKLYAKGGITKGAMRQQPDKNISMARLISEGGREQDVMLVGTEDHYGRLHPTQKPVGLLRRLLNLVKPEGKGAGEVLVADYFGGSFSTMVAVQELGMRGVSCEIDKEYFDIGKARLTFK